MLRYIKKFIPHPFISLYHFFLAKFASFYFGNPSKRMIVIGVTGTNGKSSTVQIIADIISSFGKKVGFISTAEMQIGSIKTLNAIKMTMPGRFFLQKQMNNMLLTGCEYAIIETSSQGIEQFRHIGINYDVAVFTNLTPEHIEAHGGFENYKKAKGKFFEHLSRMPRKKINGKIIEKVSVVNIDDPHASYFLQYSADRKIGYTFHGAYDISGVDEIRANDIQLTSMGLSFRVFNTIVESNLLGMHNAYNILCGLSACFALGFQTEKMRGGVRNIFIPGRMEMIDEGQNFIVIVDYAPEPQSVAKLYKTIELFHKNKTIHVLGSCGGGRDRARRKVLGRMAGKFSDYVIATNEDPYDDDPMEIINEVAQGAQEVGKKENINIFKILDRREAMHKAFSLAKDFDLVLITGKGCEQAMVVKNNEKISWDDRRVAREELRKVFQKNFKSQAPNLKNFSNRSLHFIDFFSYFRYLYNNFSKKEDLGLKNLTSIFFYVKLIKKLKEKIPLHRVIENLSHFIIR